MNDIEFKSTFDKIEFDIAMEMYMKHNSKIASINEHLGEMYSYKDLEDAKALEEYDTLQKYKKALKEKCDVIDKAIKYIEYDMPYLEEPDKEFERCDGTTYMTMKKYDESILLKILKGEDNE